VANFPSGFETTRFSGSQPAFSAASILTYLTLFTKQKIGFSYGGIIILLRATM
jgi:hypothetical protein